MDAVCLIHDELLGCVQESSGHKKAGPKASFLSVYTGEEITPPFPDVSTKHQFAARAPGKL